MLPIAHGNCTNGGYGKERRTQIGPQGYLNRSAYLNRSHPLLKLPWGLLALCRWTLGGERHRYAIAWPNKLGTDPVAIDGIDGRRGGKREYQGVSTINSNSNRLSINQSDSAWVWRTSGLTLDGTAEPVSRDQILRRELEQRNIHFPCSADPEQDWQPYQVDPYFVISSDHTYIHTYNPSSPECSSR